MKTVVLLFALVSPEGTRVERQVPWDGSLMQCMLFGQQVVAREVADRPGYVLAKEGYKCDTTGGTRPA